MPLSSSKRCALISFALVILIAGIDLWIVSAGRIVDWPQYGNYTDMLANAFLQGQLSLLEEPRPELLALSDPYDASANREYRLHDAVLFDGKYYLYWGPVPALLLAFAKLAGVGHVGDQHLVYLLELGTLMWLALLIHFLWKWRFATCPYWTVVTAIVVAGLATPLPYLLARASVYEVAILGGQFFLSGGIYWVMTALRGQRISVWRLLLGGLFWGAAMGSRLSLSPLAGLLAVAVVVEIRRRRLRTRLAACVVLPILLALFGLGSYNQARFGSFGTPGVRYLLASGPATESTAHSMFSARYLVANSLNYLFSPVRPLAQFPFVEPRFGRAVVGGDAAPKYYRIHVATGLMVTTPYLGLALVLLLRRLRAQARGEADWTNTALWTAGIGAALGPVLFLFYCTTRYLGDWVPLLVILATVGVWQLHEMWAHRQSRRRMLATVVTGLAIWSAVLGVLLSITGESHHFRTNSPQLLQRLERMSF